MRGIDKKRIFKWLRRSLIVLLLYLLLGATLPHLGEKSVGDEALARLDSLDYTADEVGPDRVTLIESTGEAYGARMELIRAAEDTLDIVYYTMDGAESTDAFLGEVIAAADRGVEVRILVDSKLGASGSSARALRTAAGHENITWREYNRLNILKPWTWQAVLHDKFILVDGDYLILGGRNIGDRFFNPESYDEAVTDDRDVLVWRESPDGDSVLDQVADYMELLWSSEDVRERRGSGDRADFDALIAEAEDFAGRNPQYLTLTLADFLDRTVETNKITLLYNPIHTAQKEPWVAYGVYRMAELAEEEIWVQTPYATGNKSLLGALESLAEDNEVRLLTNSLASSPNFPAYSNYNANRQKFLDTGITISEYQSTDSIHGKSVVVDGRLTAVGSLNMDNRSFYLDTETMLIIDSEPFGQEILQAMGDIEAKSLVVDRDGDYLPRDGVEAVEASRAKRILMAAASLFSRPLQFMI